MQQNDYLSPFPARLMPTSVGDLAHRLIPKYLPGCSKGPTFFFFWSAFLSAQPALGLIGSFRHRPPPPPPPLAHGPTLSTSARSSVFWPRQAPYSAVEAGRGPPKARVILFTNSSPHKTLALHFSIESCGPSSGEKEKKRESKVGDGELALIDGVLGGPAGGSFLCLTRSHLRKRKGGAIPNGCLTSLW